VRPAAVSRDLFTFDSFYLSRVDRCGILREDATVMGQKIDFFFALCKSSTIKEYISKVLLQFYSSRDPDQVNERERADYFKPFLLRHSDYDMIVYYLLPWNKVLKQK